MTAKTVARPRRRFVVSTEAGARKIHRVEHVKCYWRGGRLSSAYPAAACGFVLSGGFRLLEDRGDAPVGFEPCARCGHATEEGASEWEEMDSFDYGNAFVDGAAVLALVAVAGVLGALVAVL